MANQIAEHDSITGETIVRNMTADELSQHKLDEAEFVAQAEAAAVKAAAKQDVLDRLGITAEEARMLLA